MIKVAKYGVGDILLFNSGRKDGICASYNGLPCVTEEIISGEAMKIFGLPARYYGVRFFDGTTAVVRERELSPMKERDDE